ncbi:hypothetical protein [Aureispira anguillae]|uniref:Uncharacterized protein n=1 Tax=Aureispira anguillae TaxID=2864201 RepID=A0A916DV50_9BACT|nr:hypothetical protein [Aureispira anguillae]BDS13362.1 hypothetical protein AsAng_0040990 [Aureispira anguillae]
MNPELLDFDTPQQPNTFERLLAFIQAVPLYQKVLAILLFALGDALIIFFKASKPFEWIEIAQVWGGLLLLIVFFSSLLKAFLLGINFLYQKITGKTSQLTALNSSSITLMVAFLSFITLLILAYFID